VKFIVITFAFLGWSFYEMSGGSEFEPAKAHLMNIKVDPLKPAAIESGVLADADTGAKAPEVTRVSLNLTSVNDVLTEGGVRTADLPQQSAAAALDTDTATQGETVVILPSLIAGATPEANSQAVQATQEQVVTASFETAADIRSVTANRVNVRGGPGTDFSIVGKLTRGVEVEGWLADFLLSNG
jgi:hypothetical protein